MDRRHVDEVQSDRRRDPPPAVALWIKGRQGRRRPEPPGPGGGVARRAPQPLDRSRRPGQKRRADCRHLGRLCDEQALKKRFPHPLRRVREPGQADRRPELPLRLLAVGKRPAQPRDNEAFKRRIGHGSRGGIDLPAPRLEERLDRPLSPGLALPALPAGLEHEAADRR